MHAALAGRRIDAPGAPPRFPLAAVARVSEALRAVLVQRGVTRLTCSAACGTDLVALPVARELGIACEIVLPFEVERFRETSVADRPGEWGALFDEQIALARAERRLTVLDGDAEVEEAYGEVTRALVRAVSGDASSRSLAIAVWEGQPRAGRDHTEEFRELCHAAGVEVIDILTSFE